MATPKPCEVSLIAHTSFTLPSGMDLGFIKDSSDADSLVEFAGRACYETWDRPNPHTASNEAYIRHIMEVGHTALLEHPTATFYIRGLSRGCAHEFMRHRHLSFSQLSQRFTPDDDIDVVVPAEIAKDKQLTDLFLEACDVARDTFSELLSSLEKKTPGGASGRVNALLRQKQARQAARAILPSATETRLVATGNFRTWRHFIGMRATENADQEIRHLAIAILKELQSVAPHAFGDFSLTELSDGTEVATSPFVSES